MEHLGTDGRQERSKVGEVVRRATARGKRMLENAQGK